MLPPTQAGSFHLPRGAVPHGQGQEADLRYAPLGWSCSFQPLSQASSLPVQPQALCRGSLQAAHSKLSSSKEEPERTTAEMGPLHVEVLSKPWVPQLGLPAVPAPWTRAHCRP